MVIAMDANQAGQLEEPADGGPGLAMAAGGIAVGSRPS
jgi:hypothetical protein